MYVFIKNLTTIELISTSEVLYVCLYSSHSTQTQQHYITIALQCISHVTMMCKTIVHFFTILFQWKFSAMYIYWSPSYHKISIFISNVGHNSDYIICIIVTDMEGNIRIYRLPKGRGTGQWKWYCLSRRRRKYHFHWSVPRPKGSQYIMILPSISVTIVFIALKTRIMIHTK